MDPKTGAGEVTTQPLIETKRVAMLNREPDPLTPVARPPRGQSRSLVRLPRNGYMPVSFSQLREWFLQTLEGESYAYNIPLAMRLRGGLNVEALRQSINEVV